MNCILIIVVLINLIIQTEMEFIIELVIIGFDFLKQICVCFFSNFCCFYDFASSQPLNKIVNKNTSSEDIMEIPIGWIFYVIIKSFWCYLFHYWSNLNIVNVIIFIIIYKKLCKNLNKIIILLKITNKLNIYTKINHETLKRM